MARPKTKTCPFCQQPMSLLELGPSKFPIWVHRGEDLKKCHMLVVPVDFGKRLLQKLDKLGVKFGDQPRKNGRYKLHGEP